jgi:hypothetical protein
MKKLIINATIVLSTVSEYLKINNFRNFDQID